MSRTSRSLFLVFLSNMGRERRELRARRDWDETGYVTDPSPAFASPLSSTSSSLEKRKLPKTTFLGKGERIPHIAVFQLVPGLCKRRFL